MKAFVISLNQPYELLSKLRQQGVDAELFNAVRGKDLSFIQIRKYCNWFWSLVGPKSAIGCAVSHYKLWEKLVNELQNENDMALIFEDDVIINQHFSKQLNKYLQNVPKNFDLLYLGCFGCINNNEFINNQLSFSGMDIPDTHKINTFIKKPSVVLATHAYIITRKGARKMIQLLKQKINNHIDWCIQYLHSQNKIQVYAITKDHIVQTSPENVSENSTNIHPFIVYKLFRNIDVEKHLPLSYVSTVSIVQFGSYTFTSMSLWSIIIGLVLAATVDVSVAHLTIAFLIISLPDLMLKTGYHNIFFHYILFILAFVLGNRLYSK